MNSQIADALANGRLILLLGAGASLTSQNRQGERLLGGAGLAKLLADEAKLPYDDEALPVVYSAVKRPLGDRLGRVLERLYKHTKPSREYLAIAKFPWARIYTLNIDDALETAFRKQGVQGVNVRYRFDKVADRSPFYDEIDIVKLNGSIDRLSEGLIFSPQEYGAASAKPPLWYEEVAQDFFRYTFLFIGTQLAEPLFFHQIERFRMASGSVEGESYVLTPSASPIQAKSLQELNLVHIPGTLDAFVKWLVATFKVPPSPLDVAKKAYPELGLIVGRNPNGPRLTSLFENVIRVSRTHLSSLSNETRRRYKVQDFYRGFKPTWREILDAIPARLRVVGTAHNRIRDSVPGEQLFVIYGPAGSGKTTALMQCALELAEKTKRPVYFLAAPVKNLREVIESIEESSDGLYYFCIDRISAMADGVHEVLKAARTPNLRIIATERQNVWLSKTIGIVGNNNSVGFEIESITRREAEAILEKLERFGPWHRLSRMNPERRIEEILTRSQRQLLIGLLEATNGQGFDQIIRRDFNELPNSESRKFVVLVGLATIHRLGMPEVLASRALQAGRVVTGIKHLLELTSGIVKKTGSSLSARHAVYIERLFDLAVSKQEKHDAIQSLLEAFSVYSRPLMKSLGRVPSNIFKLTVNHRYLKNTFDGDMNLVLSVYENFAKAFQDDGLFWLHYGLALRDFGRNSEALEKLKFARQTTRLRHAEHAYAQQLFILTRTETSPTLVAAYLAEAKGILEMLDSESDGYVGDEIDYPIVTLSENHVEISRRLNGDGSAREIAGHYSNIIAQRIKENPSNTRLALAWKALTAYATGGELQMPT